MKSIRSSSRSWNFCCHLLVVAWRVAADGNTYITGSFPIPVPASRGFLQGLDRRFILIARAGQLDLRFLELRLVLPLFLPHDHVRLRQESLDAQTVLFVPITSLKEV
jgi:hypothetical protein